MTEIEMIEQIQSNGNNSNAMELLIKQYTPLICKLARKINPAEMEDMVQVGAMGLWRAAKNFKESYNVKFSTYAYRIVSNIMLWYVRESRTIKTSETTKTKLFELYGKDEALQILSPLSIDDESFYIPQKTDINIVEDEVIQNCNQKALKEIFMLLPADKRKLFCEYYGILNFQKQETKDLCEEYNMSTSKLYNTIFNCRNVILEKGKNIYLSLVN